jgi:phosphoenolpyruvate carboxykinase (ATP)
METYGLEKLGIINASAVYRNLTPAQLTEHAGHPSAPSTPAR